MKQSIYWTIMLAAFIAATGCDKDEPKYDPDAPLYAQPLPVIKKAIEGKWKVYSTMGGVVGLQYHNEVYKTFYDNKHILENYDENIFSTTYYVWKKKNIDILGCKTYVMCSEYIVEGWEHYFYSLKNDTLISNSSNGEVQIIYIKPKEQ